MYTKISIILSFMLGYIILRYIISYFTKQRQIDGYRDQPINIPNFGSGGVNISSTVYDINSPLKTQYCNNNPKLCNKTL